MVDHLKFEIDALRADIILISDRLLNPFSPITIPSTPKLVDPLPSPIQQLSPSPGKTRKGLTKLTSKFRQARQRSRKISLNSSQDSGQNYKSLEDSNDHKDVVVSIRRRESDASEITLVDRPTKHQGKGQDASTLLAILAPLVSALQKLTPQLLSINANTLKTEGIVTNHEEICMELITLLTSLNEGVSTDVRVLDVAVVTGIQGEEHDLEMRSLLLSALVRKVQAEQKALNRHLESLNPNFNEKGTTDKQDIMITFQPSLQRHNHQNLPVPSSNPQIHPSTNTHRSPLLPIPSNPFILHSTSLTSLTPPQLSKPIPIPNPPSPTLSTSMTVQNSFQSFISNSQSTIRAGGTLSSIHDWSLMGVGNNVIRLGSFQNSLLFSPSPVAVKRPLIVGRGMIGTQG